MKLILVTVIDTDKNFSDGITMELPDGKVGSNIDLGIMLLDCEKVIRRTVKEAKDMSECDDFD